MFTIPSAFSRNTNGIYNPSRNATRIDLFSEANKASIDLVQHANSYFLEYETEYHGENAVWAGEKYSILVIPNSKIS